MKPTEGELAIIQIVKEMRNAQKEYFKTRSKEALILSKDLEKRVDNMIMAYELDVSKLNESLERAKKN